VKGHPVGVVLPLALILGTAALSGCRQEEARPAVVEARGDRSWLGTGTLSAGDSEYILQQVDRSSEFIEFQWPPPYRSRVIDITVDVTGSVATWLVHERGRVMPLSEYYLTLLDERLLETGFLQPGDEVVVRIFGANYDGTAAEARDMLRFAMPRQVVRARVQTLERRHNDMLLEVVSVSGDTTTTSWRIAQRIQDWLRPYVIDAHDRQEVYRSTPFLEHVKRVARQLPADGRPAVVIFLTDGLFQTGPFDFRPETVHSTPRLVDGIERYVGSQGGRPFEAAPPSRTARLPVRVIVAGLNTRSDQRFARAQEDLLRWFFSPIPVELLEF
jgi:hypothetical protein